MNEYEWTTDQKSIHAILETTITNTIPTTTPASPPADNNPPPLPPEPEPESKPALDPPPILAIPFKTGTTANVTGQNAINTVLNRTLFPNRLWSAGKAKSWIRTENIPAEDHV